MAVFKGASVLQVENDVYCTYANRVNYEAKWSPVPPDTDITTLAGGLHASFCCNTSCCLVAQSSP